MLDTLGKASLVGVFAFVAALLVFAMVPSSQQPPQQNYNQPSDQNSAKEGADKDVSESSWHAFWRSIWREPINLFTAVLAAFTGILAVATIGLAVATYGLWDYAAEQAKDMKRNIEATKNAADAANKSAGIAEVSLKAIQRPIVTIYTDFEYGDLEGVVTTAILKPRFKNLGPTSALQLEAWHSFKFIAPNEGIPTFDVAAAQHTTIPVIGASEMRSAFSDNFPLEEMVRVQKREARLVAWVYAEYRDAIPDMPVHKTEVCVEAIVMSDLEKRALGFVPAQIP